MSEKVARTLSHVSNRARGRESADRKVVYKSVLDTPYRMPWPAVPHNVQNALLACAITMLDGVSEFQRIRQQRNRKRKKIESDSSWPQETLAPLDENDRQELLSDGVHPPPPILQHVTFGINEVTKKLEMVSRSHRQAVSADAEGADKTNHQGAQLVLVCQADIDPPILIGHLPHLVATCNSACQIQSSGPRTTCIWLVPLPKGSESKLAEAAGLRRVSVMAIDGSAPGFSCVNELVGAIPILSAPWSKPQLAAPAKQLVPTHIKQLRTTAPKDMKTAKEQRAKGRAAAKERKKLSIPKRTKI